MRIIVNVIITTSLLGCSQQNASSTTEVEDIQSMAQRSDGSFDVRCRDGHNEIRSASEIRSGDVCGGGNNNSSLLCVSRDNDGRDPWVLARLDQNGHFSKIDRTLFATQPQCRASLDAVRSHGGGATLCLSRDNDGRDPWNVANVNFSTGVIKPLKDNQFAKLEDCTGATGDARNWQGNLLMCGSRDRDGRDPWVMTRVTAQGDLVRIEELLYENFGQCQTSLKAVRVIGETALICGSRDRDGRDPWNMYRVSTDGTTRLDLTFGTLPACVAAEAN